jgi:flagellar biosynthesis activator protein FlaF
MPQEKQSLDQGYENVPQGGLPQYTEAWALIESARRMAEATTVDNAKEAMREAIRLNWRLWTIFQAELTVGESNAPEDIRLNMLTLCKYVDKHTVGAIQAPSAAKIEVLVNINRNIAGGLLDNLKRQAEELEKSDKAQQPQEQQEQQEQPAEPPITSFDESV